MAKTWIKFDGWVKRITIIATMVAALVPGVLWLKKKIKESPKAVQKIQNTRTVEVLAHQNISTLDMLMTLMDKIEGEYYTIGDGGALTNCMLLKTAEDEAFVIFKDDYIGWISYPAYYNDTRRQWYYYSSGEDWGYDIIYER